MSARRLGSKYNDKQNVHLQNKTIKQDVHYQTCIYRPILGLIQVTAAVQPADDKKAQSNNELKTSYDGSDAKREISSGSSGLVGSDGGKELRSWMRVERR